MNHIPDEDLIAYALDDLEAEKRPASTDPIFSDLWNRQGQEAEILGRVIKRWRSQGR